MVGYIGGNVHKCYYVSNLGTQVNAARTTDVTALALNGACINGYEGPALWFTPLINNAACEFRYELQVPDDFSEFPATGILTVRAGFRDVGAAAAGSPLLELHIIDCTNAVEITQDAADGGVKGTDYIEAVDLDGGILVTNRYYTYTAALILQGTMTKGRVFQVVGTLAGIPWTSALIHTQIMIGEVLVTYTEEQV